MIGAIVVFIGLLAVGALVVCYCKWVGEAKNAGATNHDYKYIENTDDTEDEDDE